jgi:ribosomal protein S1
MMGERRTATNHHQPSASKLKTKKVKVAMELPAEGSIERGRVSRIEPYGAFVELEKYRSRGLVHISQIVK